MIRLLSGIFLFVFLSLFGRAQGPFLFTHMGPRDGLGSNYVLSVAQDRKGYIWIATQDGLQRYDGNRFLNINPRKGITDSIRNEVTFILKIDSKDRLWMLIGGFYTGYLNTEDLSFHEVPVLYDREILSKSGGVMDLDHEGNIIVTAVGHACFTYDEEKEMFIESANPFRLPAGWKPYTWFDDHTENCFWIGCDSGLVKYNTANGQLSYRGHNEEKDKRIEAFGNAYTVVQVYRDTKRRFWIGYWSKNAWFLKTMDTESGKIKEWQAELGRLFSYWYFNLGFIKETSDGELWLGGDHILAKLLDDQDRFQALVGGGYEQFSIHYDNINGLTEDREKNLWFCTDKGLYRCNPGAQVFRTINMRRPGSDSTIPSEITDAIQLKNGEIWVSTWGNGVFTYDSNFNPIRSPYFNKEVRKFENLTWCLFQHSNGDIWSGEQDGVLYIYHSSTGKTERIADPAFEGSTIRQMVEDPDGNLWFGTQRGYLVKYDSTTNRFTLQQKFGSVISRLITDKEGNVWVGTNVAGARKVNYKDGTVLGTYKKYIKEGEGILGLGVSDILPYNDTSYLISGNGISVLNPRTGKYRYFSRGTNFPTNNVIGMVSDEEGRIWMATGRGIYNYDPDRRVLSNFTEVEGVPNNSYNVASNNRFLDGRIVFGTPYNLLAFQPKEIGRLDSLIPRVEITGIQVMNSPLFMDSVQNLDILELSYDQNSLVIEFSTLTYLNRFGVLYKMEGVDKEWQGGGTISRAVYSYLPPGHYTFRVHAENGRWESPSDTILQITVAPPFWKSWWFYGLLIIGAVGILYWIDRERMQRKESLHDMRGQIANNLHEQVNTALNNINILSEMARIKALKDPEKSIEYIEQIHHKSHDMIESMDDMLWSIDPVNDDMQKTIDRMREYVDAMNNQYNASTEMLIDQRVARLSLNMKFRHDAFLLFKECVNGLFQAGVNLCKIHLAIEKSSLLFTIDIRNQNSDLHQFRTWLQRMEMERKRSILGAEINLQFHKELSTILMKIPLSDI